jgi:hypothetical protein
MPTALRGHVRHLFKQNLHKIFTYFAAVMSTQSREHGIQQVITILPFSFQKAGQAVPRENRNNGAQ